MARKKSKIMLSAYSIILILIVALGIITHILPDAKYTTEEVDGKTCLEMYYAEEVTIDSCTTTINDFTTQELSGETCNEKIGNETEFIPTSCKIEKFVDGSGTRGATLSEILLSPILGFENAIDVAIFIMMLGGLLAIINKTGALETGVKVLVKKLKGREILLIPILMFLFSICGTTYGMLEETLGFYILLAATMMAAGMDPLVGSAVVLLGAGSGVLGSTVNPFATGVALSALPDGIAANQGLVILIAVALWISTYVISCAFVMKYARKVQKDKGSTFLSLREQNAAEKKYGKFSIFEKDIELTTKQKATLIIFGLTFLVMIIGFIPWGEFGVTFFDGFTGWLTGSSLGNWWFYEAALWFLIMTIVIGIVNKMNEKTIVDTFVDGADDMIGVILVIAVARGVSVLMGQTYLDNYVIYNASKFLANVPEIVFVPLNYLLHVVLSILVPSSSGLATISTPIIAPVAANLGYSIEVTLMGIVSANGLVNLITPTCGAIMGGLALAKVEYSTWFKWAFKLVALIAVANIVILSVFALIG